MAPIMFLVRACFCLTLATPTVMSLTDEATGCPGWGCTPSGTFSLSSDLPGTTNRPVGIKWTTKVSPGIPVGPSTRLGCVSCQAPSVVCATGSGYVAVDQTKGTVIWRYDNMTSPSLPIMNLYGDVIGTDGRKLIKINADGSLEPVITIHAGLAPMYSVMLANDNLFLMTSYVDPVLIAYGTDGVPEAAYTVKDVVEMVNGTFYTITQPVISGKRAYFLMQFVPDPDTPPQVKQATMGLQRLYAVDLWARMVKRISPVWSFSFGAVRQGNLSDSGREPSPCPEVKHAVTPRSADVRNNGSVLVSNDTVYVSLAHPTVARPTMDQEGTLWAIRDEGNTPKLIFKTTAPVSSLSLYDVSLGRRPTKHRHGQNTGSVKKTHGNSTSTQLKWSHKQRNAGRFPHDQAVLRKDTDNNNPKFPPNGVEVLWAAMSRTITGYNSADGSVEYVIDACSYVLKTADPCRITSKVMVAHSDDDEYERLVFAVATTNITTTTSFVIALDVGEAGSMRLLWRVAGKPSTEIVGQIANVVYMPTKKNNHQKSRTSSSANRVRIASSRRGEENWATDDKLARNRAVNMRSELPVSNSDDVDDVEVVLLGIALSETDQLTVAIGHV